MESDVNQAQAKLDALVANLQTEFPKEYPPQAGWSVRVLSAHQQLVGNVQTILYVVLAAVGLVLLIGCVNLANLMLARSSGASSRNGHSPRARSESQPPHPSASNGEFAALRLLAGHLRYS